MRLRGFDVRLILNGQSFQHIDFLFTQQSPFAPGGVFLGDACKNGTVEADDFIAQ